MPDHNYIQKHMEWIESGAHRYPPDGVPADVHQSFVTYIRNCAANPNVYPMPWEYTDSEGRVWTDSSDPLLIDGKCDDADPFQLTGGTYASWLRYEEALCNTWCDVWCATPYDGIHCIWKELGIL